LGVRFWDPVEELFLTEGLDVSARPVGRPWPVGQPDPGVRLIPNRRGSFLGHGLPGLTDSEHGRGDDAYWAELPVGREFEIHFADSLDRFVPLRLRAVLPFRGWAFPDCLGSPPNLPPEAVPLFSSSARPVPVGRAVVRADLWDRLNETPAAWSVVTVTAQTPTGPYSAIGVTDARGRLAVIFAYPELPPPPAPTSPPTQGVNLTDHSWSLQISVRYAALSADGADVPELCAILGQPITAVDALVPPVLLAGRELTLFSSTDPLRRGLVVPG